MATTTDPIAIDPSSANPFEVLGITRRLADIVTRHLGNAEDLQQFRQYLKRHRQTINPFTHPDRKIVTTEYAAAVNLAYDHLAALSNQELRKLAREYIEGGEEAFGLRYQLRSALSTAQQAEEEKQQLELRLESINRSSKALATKMGKTLEWLFRIVAQTQSEEGCHTAFDYRGYGFVGALDTRYRNKGLGRLARERDLISLIRAPLYYVRPDGVVIERLTIRKYLRQNDVPLPGARHDLTSKIIATLEDLYQNEYARGWSLRGVLVGFTSYQAVAAKSKAYSRLGSPISYGEVAVILSQITTSEIVSLTGYDSLVTVKLAEGAKPPRFVIEIIQFYRDLIEPIPPKW